MTTLSKGKRGWQAEDLIDFNGQQKLLIETYKYDGRLITHAAVNTYNGHGGFSHAFGLAGGGDFSERVIVTSARCTEKSVSEQHAQAMSQLADIQARARAHYRLGE
jgi:hypothetical protein